MIATVMLVYVILMGVVAVAAIVVSWSEILRASGYRFVEEVGDECPDFMEDGEV